MTKKKQRPSPEVTRLLIAHPKARQIQLDGVCTRCKGARYSFTTTDDTRSILSLKSGYEYCALYCVSCKHFGWWGRLKSS